MTTLEPDVGVALRQDAVAVRWPTWLAAVGVAGAGGWLGLIGYRTLVRDRDLMRGVVGAQSAMVGPALVIVVTAVYLAERRWPAVPRPALARAHVIDAVYLAVFAASGPAVTLVSTGFAVVVERYAPFLILHRLPLVPQVAVVAMILVATDAMNWVAHVANHRSAPLWRFHALHHSQEDLNVFTTFRTHPFSHVSYLPSVLPALVLGASGGVPRAALITYGCFVTLPHANLPWTFGRIGSVLVSPAYHRLHHADGPVAGRPAVNFGFVLVCWDRIAGCAVHPIAGAAAVSTGLAGRPVPVEQSGGGTARVVLAQLAQPFRRQAMEAR